MNAARAKLGGLLDTVSRHAKPALGAAEKEVTSRYSQIMKDNQQYVVKDQAQASKLFKQWYFTKMASIPDSIATAQKEATQLKQTVSKGSNLHLAEIGTLALFAGEVYAWFVVGEIVGRGSLVDYEVKV